ncbi:MAG: hypothetical protein WA417_12385 [Stellaceae bacterium]|jgi:hypothetical protein
MTLDLTEDETRALVRLLRKTLDEDPFPLAPRLDPLKTILASPTHQRRIIASDG